MEDGKREPDAEASSSTNLKRRRTSDEHESGSPHPDAPEKINEPSEPEANSEPPASYADVIGNSYYVFLSFRGPDTRKGFVDHLYHELARVGLHHPNFVFRDDESLPFGKPIAENILSAIKRSKVSIPVISKNYAASKWCLHEIIQIMKCVESGQQKVYPVLYKVTTGDVKDMQGEFGEAFHNPDNRIDEKLKREGRVALRKALRRRVFELKNFAGYQGKLVKALVKEIMHEQQHDFLSSPVGLVGIDDHVAKVMKLANAPSETHIIVIYGIGGIGKTTLAMAIYKKLSNKFECSSFLKDIRETIKNKGMKHVQSLHISNLTKDSDHSEDVSDIKKIQITCDKKKVLIFLDDVDRRDHIDNLIGGCKFESGSWIIITCRDQALLKSEYKEYKLEEMNPINSLLLFSRYAFEEETPPPELEALSSDIVATTGGLPLALVIIGSFLKGKSQSIWTETREKLRKVPPTDVQQKLRISYDSLEYEEQQMFLDISCFFIGINKRFAAYLWKDLQYYVDSGLERMIELSLIKIDDNDELRMHDQLRDLGRAIACPANKKAWKCSRLWDEKAIIVQRSKEENRYIEALRLDENGSNMFMNQRSFKRMPYLKFLHLSKVAYVGNFEDSLSELRWLEWEKCPNYFGVTNLHLEKLLILDLSYGYISHEWRGWSSIKMERLKVLNLSHCFDLVITPNLSAFKSLEILILEYCHKLEEIDPSIGDAKFLTSLNLSNCLKLKKLPSQLGELKRLTSLNLSNCLQLKKLPSQLGELKHLTSLNLSNCLKLKKLPSQLGELKRLISLNLSSCETLEELPKEMGKLEELKELTIHFVKIEEIPPSIGSLTKLEILNAHACKSLVGLPDSISHLVNLSTLDLRWCNEFKNLPESIGSLVKLQRLLLGNMLLPFEDDSWYYWDPSADYQFNRIPDSIGKLVSLTELHLTCAKISELPNFIGDLKSLKILKIVGCKDLSNLPSTLSKLVKLEELDATVCKSLKGGVPINGLSSLKILRLGKLGHAALTELTYLNLNRCESIRNLPDLSLFDNLRELHIRGCSNLPDNIPGLERVELVFPLSRKRGNCKASTN
ncbi:hypothetical protein EUGRSUZ_C00289 [Eucalyptus grandis]|uniref:Uncharacterized protein n=1 Tax=Eucalyptus grandis TaxID=71139 RepID=A0ACC3LAF0_EUCGR|nr:hypothetical protein EUGRSUZ_C00289 [Eucalyptus grandis]